MNFYCITGDLYEGVSKRIEHFHKACDLLGIYFISLSQKNFDFVNIPQLERTDILYNAARGGENIESLLLNSSVTSFYRNNPSFISFNSDTTDISLLLSKRGISSPKTIYNSTNNNIELQTYVNYLGGFPIVLKTKGGTLGVGTMIVNDYKSLFSLTDYLCSIKHDFIIREYIVPKEICRLVVVGDEVVASNRKHIPDGDFRTSVKLLQPESKKYSKEIEELAVKATHLSNFQTSGVDILIDKESRPYVLEVNMPHDFVTTAELTNINIAKVMVEFLIAKSKTCI